MKTKLAALVAAVLLSGCLATPGPTPGEAAAFWADHKARLELARKGERKRSDVFRESYTKLSAMPDSYDKNSILWYFNEAIAISVKLEAGEITPEQAQDLARTAETESRRQSAQAKAQAESAAAQQQAANAARAAASAQILQQWQATRPQGPVIQPNTPMNCRHYYVGSTLRTECM